MPISNHISDLIRSSVGRKIRVVRKEKKMSLQNVSLKTKLSIGALSQIERGILIPSLSSMIRIAHAFETPLGHFCEFSASTLDANHKEVFLKNGMEKLLHTSKELSAHLLYYDEASNGEIVKILFEKQEATGDQKIQHEGNEWGMVLQGRLKVEYGKRKYVLNEGDNISFRSDVPHSVTNTYDGRTAAIWFNCPALWFKKPA